MCSLILFVLKYTCSQLGTFLCKFAFNLAYSQTAFFIINYVPLIMAQDAPKRRFLSLIHLLLFIQRKYAIICTKSQTILRKYFHSYQSAFNCAKCTLHKDICIIVNIQLSFKTFINVLRNSNSSKQLSFARLVNSITSKEYSFA